MRFSFPGGIPLLFLFLFLAAAYAGTSPPSSVSALGTISVILNNDLDPTTPKITALLLSLSRPFDNAASACHLANEQLFVLDNNTSNGTLADIVNGLQGKFSTQQRTVKRAVRKLRQNYLRLPLYWVGNSTALNDTTLCPALSVSGQGAGKIIETSCAQQLPVLCSNVNVQTGINDDVPASARVTVNAPVGSFTGFRTAQSFAFKGIKYATAERFKAPVPYKPPAGVNDATAFGSVCSQLYGSVAPFGVEDCLFLNIYTPMLPSNDSTNTSLPVIFWVHGGSFIQGSGSTPYFNGQNLANRGEAVVVTFNYRLGILGWFEATMSGFPRSVFPGNQAIRDWMTALEWVQANIVSFGGDPGRVTLVGQSAGATAIRALIASPAAKGLYRGAIMQSDPIDVPFNSENTASGILGAKFVQMLGCAPANVSCLTTPNVLALMAEADKLMLDAKGADPALTLFEIFKPTIDGDLITDDFFTLVKEGKINDVPLMIGTLRDEADAFVPFLYPVPNPNVQTSLNETYGTNRTDILMSSDVYAPDPNQLDSVRHMLGQMGTDYYWTCALQTILDLSQSANKIFRYVMNRGYAIVRPDPLFCLGKVCHGDDMYLVFGSQHLAGEPVFTQDDILYTRIVQDRWISFAHTLDPNPTFPTDVQISWPPYTANQSNVMQFDVTPQLTNGYRADFCAVMQKISFDFELKNQASLA